MTYPFLAVLVDDFLIHLGAFRLEIRIYFPIVTTSNRIMTHRPFYGSRRLTAWLNRQGYPVNRKRIRRLMRLMSLEAIYPKPNLSKRRKDSEIYPYLLKGVKIQKPDFVWSSDITYIRVGRGFVYLTAIIDWFSSYVACLVMLRESTSLFLKKRF